jgi:hypothetical protein
MIEYAWSRGFASEQRRLGDRLWGLYKHLKQQAIDFEVK